MAIRQLESPISTATLLELTKVRPTMIASFSKPIFAFAVILGLLVGVETMTFAQEESKLESAKSAARPVVAFGSKKQLTVDDANSAAVKKDEQSKLAHASASKNDIDPKKTADESIAGVTYSNPITTRWRMNAIIRGGAGPAHTMLVTMPIPNHWPEQSVAIVDEDIPANIAKVSYRNLESGVRQIVVAIPQVRAREDIKISVTFEALTSQINPPSDTTLFVRPKTSHKEGRAYLGVSAQINYRNAKLKKEVKAIVKGKTEIWEQVETIYDWVRDNVEDTSTQAQDAQTTFREKKGCAEDKVGLFVAMCRAHKIPARMVWVQGAQYAEFMLIDANLDAHWFPCDVGGIREFGSVSEPRIILQKGDSIRVPEKESRQKLVAEFATCKGKSKPSVRFHREILSED